MGWFFQSRHGAETMTTSPRATLRIRTTPNTTPVVVLTNRTLIESALNDALNLVRNANTTQDIQRATGKAIKAARLLKCACEAIKTGGGK